MVKRTFDYLDKDNVISTSRMNGFSVIVALPREWLGKKIICKLAPEEKSESPETGSKSQ